MLPAGSRLHTSDDFAAVVRSGRRAGTRHLVVHLLGTGRAVAPRAGFVVSAKVGNAVVRHRVTRRLRPLVRRELAGLPDGSDNAQKCRPATDSESHAKHAPVHVKLQEREPEKAVVNIHDIAS